MIPYSLTTKPPVAAMFLRAPLAMPSPREMVEAEAHRLIEVLDSLEDFDLEDGADDEDGANDEPSLGSGEPGIPSRFALDMDGRAIRPGDQTHWAEGARDDREQDAGDDREEENEHGNDCDDEPSLGSLGGCGVGSYLAPQTEWSLGGTNDRELDDSDLEHSLGSLGGTAAGCEFQGWGHNGGDLEPDGDDEPSLGSLDGTALFDEMPQTRWAEGGSDDREREHEREEDHRNLPRLPPWSGQGVHEAFVGRRA